MGTKRNLFLTIQPFGKDETVGSDSQTIHPCESSAAGGNQNAESRKSERKSIHDQKSNQSRRIRISVGTWLRYYVIAKQAAAPEKSRIIDFVLRVQTGVGDLD